MWSGRVEVVFSVGVTESSPCRTGMVLMRTNPYYDRTGGMLRWCSLCNMDTLAGMQASTSKKSHDRSCLRKKCRRELP